ncbi:uncharacterized protein SOCE26_106750 [Sorangium cellulosum]|uniref:Uncharacterized protein n=1 Tax=Sorangium cellulosum TaxID=56 RepID=A0A2L0FC11_SORCE|nr:uncharacterized protein SOCE26_106750 [Sorangium cellulosum]
MPRSALRPLRSGRIDPTSARGPRIASAPRRSQRSPFAQGGEDHAASSRRGCRPGTGASAGGGVRPAALRAGCLRECFPCDERAAGTPGCEKECRSDAARPGPPSPRCGTGRCVDALCEVEINGGILWSQVRGDCRQLECTNKRSSSSWRSSATGTTTETRAPRFRANTGRITMCSSITISVRPQASSSASAPVTYASRVSPSRRGTRNTVPSGAGMRRFIACLPVADTRLAERWPANSTFCGSSLLRDIGRQYAARDRVAPAAVGLAPTGTR